MVWFTLFRLKRCLYVYFWSGVDSVTFYFKIFLYIPSKNDEGKNTDEEDKSQDSHASNNVIQFQSSFLFFV